MIRAFQWDLARQVERLDWLLAQLPRYAEWGYQELYVHLEDAIDYPSLPGVARGDAYSRRQFAQLVRAAGRAGIAVVPIVNLLGHTQYLIKAPAWRDLNECRAPDGSPLPNGQVCPAHPGTLEAAERLLRDMEPFCTAGKVHVGLDESYLLGGHPRSQAEIARIGMAGHFARYVGRLHKLAGQFGLKLGMWADMLALLPAAIPQLPAGIAAYDWYYYPFARLPRLEPRNFADYDLAAPLRSRGIDYWGCPMNGAFRHEPLPVAGERLGNIVSWWKRCRREDAAGILITSWEPSRLAAELPLAVDAAAAGLWLDGEEDPGRLWAAGCRRAFGRRGGGAARAVAAADLHPFSGYPRWQINDRWDTLLDGEPLERWRREASACRRLARRKGLPPAVRASLGFRSYLAERDAFVREAGLTAWGLRRALDRGRRASAARILACASASAARFSQRIRAGRAAARIMWRRTRDPRCAGPNETIVDRDRSRLREWSAWLRARQGEFRRPGPGRGGIAIPGSAIFRASPVAGAWQVLFTVANFAPALQKVVLEQRGDGGRWRDIHGFFLIEFAAAAARRRSRRMIRFSAPVDWGGPPAPPPRLRIAARGIGQFKVLDAVFTDGVERIRAGRDGRRAVILGSPAPRSGLPRPNRRENRGAWEPGFGRAAGGRRARRKTVR